MSNHILIPRNMFKENLFTTNDPQKERWVSIDISNDNMLEVSIIGDITIADKQALEIFGLQYCTQHEIKYNKNAQRLFFITDLNQSVTQLNTLEAIHHSLQIAYESTRRNKDLATKWLFHNDSQEKRFVPNDPPVKVIKFPVQSKKFCAPQI